MKRKGQKNIEYLTDDDINDLCLQCLGQGWEEPYKAELDMCSILDSVDNEIKTNEKTNTGGHGCKQ